MGTFLTEWCGVVVLGIRENCCCFSSSRDAIRTQTIADQEDFHFRRLFPYTQVSWVWRFCGFTSNGFKQSENLSPNLWIWYWTGRLRDVKNRDKQGSIQYFGANWTLNPHFLTGTNRSHVHSSNVSSDCSEKDQQTHSLHAWFGETDLYRFLCFQSVSSFCFVFAGILSFLYAALVKRIKRLLLELFEGLNPVCAGHFDDDRLPVASQFVNPFVQLRPRVIPCKSRFEVYGCPLNPLSSSVIYPQWCMQSLLDRSVALVIEKYINVSKMVANNQK